LSNTLQSLGLGAVILFGFITFLIGLLHCNLGYSSHYKKSFITYCCLRVSSARIGRRFEARNETCLSVNRRLSSRSLSSRILAYRFIYHVRFTFCRAPAGRRRRSRGIARRRLQCRLEAGDCPNELTALRHGPTVDDCMSFALSVPINDLSRDWATRICTCLFHVTIYTECLQLEPLLLRLPNTSAHESVGNLHRILISRPLFSARDVMHVACSDPHKRRSRQNWQYAVPRTGIKFDKARYSLMIENNVLTQEKSEEEK